MTVSNKLSNKFVEKRRQALQQYLRRLASHRVIGRSEELRVFLEASGELRGDMVWHSLQPVAPTWTDGARKLFFQAIGREKIVPAPAAAAQSTKTSHDVVRQVREYMHHVRHKYASSAQVLACALLFVPIPCSRSMVLYHRSNACFNT